jgi:hypothetical protein
MSTCPSWEGIEFLQAYQHLVRTLPARPVIFVLTTFMNRWELDQLRTLAGVLSKPLTQEKDTASMA